MVEESKALAAIHDQISAANTIEQHIKILSPENVNANAKMIIEERVEEVKKDLGQIVHKNIRNIFDDLFEDDSFFEKRCKNCGNYLKLVTIKKGKNQGRQYWCCSSYKRTGCRVIHYV